MKHHCNTAFLVPNCDGHCSEIFLNHPHMTDKRSTDNRCILLFFGQQQRLTQPRRPS